MARRILLAVLVLAVVAEVLLQAAARFAPSRASRWREGASYRTLCVGDSHTWGAGLSREQSYPGQLQAFLDAAEPGVHSVVNLGVPGRNTSQLRSRIPSMLSRYEPDVLVVWAGVNNAWNLRESDASADSIVARADRLLLTSRLYRSVRVLVHDLALERAGPGPSAAPDLGRRGPQHGFGRAAEADLDLVEPQAVSDLRAIVDAAQATGARVVLLTYPLATWAFEQANLAAWTVAEERDLPLVETRASLARVPGDQVEWLWALHPGAAIYREIARDVAAVVLDRSAGYAGDGSPAAYRESSRDNAVLTLRAALQVAQASPPITDAERAVFEDLVAFAGWTLADAERRGIAPPEFAERMRDARIAARAKPAAFVLTLRTIAEADGETSAAERALIDAFASALPERGARE